MTHSTLFALWARFLHTQGAKSWFGCSLSLFIIFLATTTARPETARIPVIIDTDIGSDVDDAFALGLAVASPELDIQAITTCAAEAEDRAWMVCRFLTQVGVNKLPVAFGRGKQADYKIDWQIQYRRHPAAIFNRTLKPAKESAVDLLYRMLKERPGQLTLICLGPLTNIEHLLKEHPDAKPWIKSLVIMGGSVVVGFNGKAPPEPEWNIKSDVAAAKAVFASGIPITLAPLDATSRTELKKQQRERLFSAHSMLTFQLQNLYELWDKETPILFDPVAVAIAFDERFCQFKKMRITVDDKGMTKPETGEANARVATSIDADAFVKWYVERLRVHGNEALPKPPANLSKLVDQGGFPNRVHTFEDYDTDIEKRWWMSGKAETKDVPPNGIRCCRAVLTQDFDDRQGDMKTMYRAVIFNPVPGPPMGKNTRLSFRYKLHGADKLRVQLYSLTNGYHRYLSLEGLVQDEWRHGTVDMTQMRRPDGTGGALAENERIDDIQFYIDPRADLLIDDIILYDAASPEEKRPFPKRILYTGWFDTGKQGKEWPGNFDIVEHEKPRSWKFAKSVADSDGSALIRLDMRGERVLNEPAELSMKYRVKGTNSLTVQVLKRGTMAAVSRIADLKQDQWSELTLTIPKPEKSSTVDEIVLRSSAGGPIHVDDVLLYIPGNTNPR